MHVIIMKWWMIKLFKTISFCAISLEINHWNVHLFHPCEDVLSDIETGSWQFKYFNRRFILQDADLLRQEKILSADPQPSILQCSSDHFMYAPCQWGPTLQCNVVSHWLGTYTKWSLVQSVPMPAHNLQRNTVDAIQPLTLNKTFQWGSAIRPGPSCFELDQYGGDCIFIGYLHVQGNNKKHDFQRMKHY